MNSLWTIYEHFHAALPRILDSTYNLYGYKNYSIRGKPWSFLSLSPRARTSHSQKIPRKKAGIDECYSPISEQSEQPLTIIMIVNK